jgi:Predicted periplasmic/secreted protein
VNSGLSGGDHGSEACGSRGHRRNGRHDGGALVGPLVGLPKLAIGELLSSSLAVSVVILRVGPVGGWLIHGIVGIALALLYGAVFATRLPGPPAARGALYGILVFLLAQLVFMPAVGAGVFSRGDPGLLVGSFIGHLVYGALVGAIYGEPRTATLAAA